MPSVRVIFVFSKERGIFSFPLLISVSDAVCAIGLPFLVKQRQQQQPPGYCNEEAADTTAELRMGQGREQEGGGEREEVDQAG